MRRSSASSAARVIASPTAPLMLPPTNPKSIAAIDQRQLLDRARSIERARLQPGLALGVTDPIGVGLGVEERERVERLEIAAQLLEAARIQQLGQPLGEAKAEVVVALRAHPKVALQALVVHERLAVGAPEPLCRHRSGGRGNVSQPDHLPLANGRRQAFGGSRPATRPVRASTSSRVGAGADSSASSSAASPVCSRRNTTRTVLRPCGSIAPA